ncbi:hypothetical protein Trydic_g9097 [Trypoxylus dichotomus]
MNRSYGRSTVDKRDEIDDDDVSKYNLSSLRLRDEKAVERWRRICVNVVPDGSRGKGWPIVRKDHHLIIAFGRVVNMRIKFTINDD